MSLQKGMVVWLSLILLIGISGGMLTASRERRLAQTASDQQSQQALRFAHHALLAYALQPLGLTACESNCPRPGDLPCPDRNGDGVAESSCTQSSQRFGRLPWKTLGVGELRDGSGELLWYAVSNRYKNNPRILPLNLDTPGSWSVIFQPGARYDASVGQGVAAVILAPNVPIMRSDGLQQVRTAQTSQLATHYFEVFDGYDNAQAQEDAAIGMIAAAPSPHFNDALSVVSASEMHHAMQLQVLSALKAVFLCPSNCPSLPAAAPLTDPTCVGHTSIALGGCLSTTTPPDQLGRLPLTAAGRGPIAGTSMLDANSRHHWFQQNGWRNQVFYQVRGQRVRISLPGEALAGQARRTLDQQTLLSNYFELTTLQSLHVSTVGAITLSSNDVWVEVPRP